jgi:hypothetical protein
VGSVTTRMRRITSKLHWPLLCPFVPTDITLTRE